MASARKPLSRPGGGYVLIVEDEADFAQRVIGRHFRKSFEVRYAFNIPQAREVIEELPQLTLALVDLDLPGGTPFNPERPGGYGFEIVELVRDTFPWARVVVLTGHVHPNLVNTAHRLGAEYVAKDGCAENLRALARSSLTSRRELRNRAAAFVDALQAQYELTQRQTDVLNLAVAGLSHGEIMEELRITRNTLKRHIRDILAACGERSMDAIARRFWRSAARRSG